MGERVSRLFQRTPVPEDTVSTDSGDYTTASDEDTASGSNDESCADSVDSGGTNYATADEDRASDSSTGTSEGNVLLATEHSSSISPGIATTSTTPSHQPPPSLSSFQAEEMQHRPPSQELQAPSLLFSQHHSPSIPLPQAQEIQPPDQQFQASQPPSSIPQSQAQEVQPPDQQLQASSSIPPSQVQLPDQQFQASQPLSSIPSSQVQFQGSLAHQHTPLPQAQGAQLSSHKSSSVPSSQTQPSLSSGAGTRGDSLESKALCKLSDELVNAISASDPLISWKLFARDLIRPETVEYCQLEVTQTKKSSKIVCAVIETVSASPHLFESLVSVLSESGNTALMSVGEKLKQSYESIKEGFTDSLPSSQAQEVQLPSHSPSSHQLPPPPSQLKSPELCLYANYLRAVYTQSELPIYSKWPPSPGKKFINLAIISKEGITKQEADEFTKATLHGDLEEILKKKAPVKFEDILQVNPDEELKCILIEGAPGVGKTTLSWEVCHCWGKGELYQEYSIVVLLRLRDQNVQRAERTADLFYYPDEETQKQIAKDIINSQGSGILIILDGLDELPNHLIESSVFARLLSRTELPHATILVTSRPSATYKLVKKWKQHISRHIEILGFTEDNITEYTQSVLPVNEQSKFKDYLSLHPYIRLMLYIPLHCAIVTVIYMQCQKFDKPPPKTVTELYTYLTQTILIRYLNSHSEYKDKDYTLNTFSDLPSPVYAHFLRLCELAFEGVKNQNQVFYDLPKPFEHLGFMDAVSELFVNQQSATYSYNFLHLSVQEYLAAYHASLMSHDKQERMLPKTANYYNHHSNMILFLAGITKFKDLDKAVVREAIIRPHSHMSFYALELLHECQDVSILDSKHGTHTVYIRTDSLHKLHSLGYCIANSRSKWELKFKHKSNIGADIICHSLKKTPHSNSFITGIDFESCSPEFTYQFLMLLPKYMLPHIESLIIMSAYTQPLPPQLIHRMERLETLILNTITIDTSQPELILDLSRIPTLRNLRIQSDLGNLEMFFPTDSLSSTGTIYASCIPKLVDMFLPQLPQQTIAHIGSLIVTYSYSQEGPQPLPPCLSGLIPKMETLVTLMLKNVLDTLLTELIPVLSRVSTLRNLTLHKLNLKGITYLCEWLPACQLKTLTLHEQTVALKTHKITINFCNSSIESINCQYCTAEFINQILSQLPQQSIIHVQAFTVWNEIHYNQPLPSCLPELILKMERLDTLTLKNALDTSLLPALSSVHTLRNLRIQSDSGSFEMLFPTDSLSSTGTINASCRTKLVDMILPQIPQQTISHIRSLTVTYSSKEGPQPLPLCLPELIPTMERLNTLMLENVLDTSLTELLPALPRVPTLRNLRIQSDSVNLQVLFCKVNQLHTISGTLKLFLPQLQQQCLAHTESLTMTCSYSQQEDPQPLPTYLPELILKMERLDTLTLENVLCTSLTELIPVVSRAPTLRDLTLLKLNSEDSALLFHWLPTCQQETLTLHQHTKGRVTPRIMITFCNNSIEAIEWQHCTTELIDQFLSQIPQQSTIHNIKTLKICNDQPQRPSALIQGMEQLNTLHCQHKLNSEGIAHLCQWLPTCQLETLTLPSLSPDHSVMVYKALTSVSSLKTLAIRDSEFMTFLSMQALVSLLQQNQSLTELTLTYCNIDSDSAHCLAEALYHNTTLRKLDMRGNPVGERGALAMAEMLKHNSTLEEFGFIGANTSSDDAGINHLAEALHHNTTLRKLDMRGNSVRKRGACAMAEMLEHNATLKELCLSHTEISSDGAGAIVKALYHNTTLKRLNMSDNSVGDWGTVAMAEMLKHNTTLEELNLFMTRFGSDGAVAMAKALHHNTTLRKLDMSKNPVGKRGTLAIAEMLKHNTILEEVDLSYDLIGKNGITALAESLVRNKSLKKLVVSSQYKDCVESLPVYQHIKGRVEFR